MHAVIGDPAAYGGDETLDPRRSLLSERYDGTFAERVAVPRRNLLPKPDALTFEEAACLPTAYLTAYRMLFATSGLEPGSTVLVQGAGGGVATALIMLGRAAGYRMWVTSRSEDKRERAVELGADQAFVSGERLPERVDAVMETVGEATWPHSLRALKPGGRIVICGATSGPAPSAELNRVFFLQLSVIGSTMGIPGSARPAAAVLRADRSAPGDRPHPAAVCGQGRLRGDGIRRAIRQGRLHPVGLPATPAALPELTSCAGRSPGVFGGILSRRSCAIVPRSRRGLALRRGGGAILRWPAGVVPGRGIAFVLCWLGLEYLGTDPG